MLADLKPYPEMRHSGVKWLGKVPSHWDVRRIKTLFREKGERSDDGHGELLSLTRSHGLLPQTEASNSIASIEDLSNYKVCRPSDLVMNRMQAWSGMFAVPSKEGLVSPDYSVFELASESEVKYFEHLFKTLPFVGQFAQKSRGIGSGFNRLYTADFGSTPTIVPPLSEQAAIVRFLRHADRRIRRYIRSKQKLIALLEEQKQAIIHKAVTGQIDVHTGQRYSAYKPTGEGWLQEVPAHWEIVALRRRWRVIDCKHVTVPFVDNGIPLASVRESQSFELTLETSNHTTPEWYEKLIEGGREPRPGDLIYCRNVSVGSAALVETEARFAMGQDVCLIRSASENQRWLNYFLHSKAMSDQLALILIGSTFNRINVADIKALLIAVPPVSEQDRIAAVLDDELSKIDVVIGTCRREQALLHEYRTRLITDVVTGNLDVREVAVEHPEDDGTGDDEPTDEYAIEREVTL